MDKIYSCKNCRKRFTDKKESTTHAKDCKVTIDDRIDSITDTTAKIISYQIECAKAIQMMSDEMKKFTGTDTKIEITKAPEPEIIKVLDVVTPIKEKILDETDKPEKIDIPATKATNLFIFSVKNGNLFQYRQGEWIPVSNKTIGKLFLASNYSMML